MNIAGMSMRAKLLSGFGLLLVLMLLLGGIGVVKLNGLAAESDQGQGEAYLNAGLAGAMAERALDIERRIFSRILATEAADVENEIHQIEQMRDANGDDLEKSGKLIASESGKKLFANTVAAGKTLRERYPMMFELMRARDTAKSLVFLNREFAPANRAFRQALTDLAKHHDEKMLLSLAAVRDDSHIARNIIVGATVVALIFGIVIVLGLARLIAGRVGEARAIAERIASGDLSADSAYVASKDESGQLLASLQRMRADLSATVGAVIASARKVSDYADQLSSAAHQVSTSIDSQSSATASAAAAVEELTVSIEHVSGNAEEVSRNAADAGRTAESSSGLVTAATQSILQVSGGVDSAARDMQELSEKVRDIGKVTVVIKEVADQTNLLALNAAIEAARAGEQGRGFAVVADEVRKLAERTTKSVQEITTIVAAIQAGAGAAVASMQHASQDVGNVVSRAEGASGSMTEICSAAAAVERATHDISSALGEQRSAATDLSRSVESIAQMSEQNSAAANDVALTAHKMSDVSRELMGSVERFRL